MKLPVREERDIDEQAAAWLEVLRRNNPAERAAFAAWVKESPRHVRAFLLMSALDIELDGVDADRKLSASVESARVVQLNPGTRLPEVVSPTPAWRRPILWAAALAVVALGGVLSTLLVPQRYSTVVGEQRTLDLPDGSVVYLNTDSKLALDYSRAAREIRLLTGEALFKVSRDPSRPFRVRTDDAVVQAMGTEFNVQHTGEGTRVAVVEGQVKVGDEVQLFGAGEEATIARQDHLVKRARADVARTLAWRQRRLMFRTDRLADIAAEFNRYNRSPQIRIENDAMATRRFSGVFDADDPESLAQVLEGSDGVAIVRSEREILIKHK